MDDRGRLGTRDGMDEIELGRGDCVATGSTGVVGILSTFSMATVSISSRSLERTWGGRNPLGRISGFFSRSSFKSSAAT